MIGSHRSWVFLCLLIVLQGQSAGTSTSPPKPQITISAGDVHWEPVRIVNGSPIVFRVRSRERLTSLSGKWLGHEVIFSSDAVGRNWYALAGVSLETRPGKYALEL